jgi:transcriptional regulator with XRE-family HTH domain
MVSLVTDQQASDVLAFNVSRLRQARGHEVADLAKILSWSVEDVQDLESGRRESFLDDLDHLSSALGVEPDELFRAEG